MYFVGTSFEKNVLRKLYTQMFYFYFKNNWYIVLLRTSNGMGASSPEQCASYNIL